MIAHTIEGSLRLVFSVPTAAWMPHPQQANVPHLLLTRAPMTVASFVSMGPSYNLHMDACNTGLERELLFLVHRGF